MVPGSDLPDEEPDVNSDTLQLSNSPRRVGVPLPAGTLRNLRVETVGTGVGDVTVSIHLGNGASYALTSLEQIVNGAGLEIDGDPVSVMEGQCIAIHISANLATPGGLWVKWSVEFVPDEPII